MIDISRFSNSPVKKIPEDYCPEGDINFFEIKKGYDKGKKMFFRNTHIGGNNQDTCLVFVHGNPESSYTYRNIIKYIVKIAKKSYRIISMDHIGFGLSDQASHEMLCIDHAENLVQLIRELDLQNVTLIVHDWGGPIGIGAFLQEPERVSNLVLLNTTVFPIPKAGMTFHNYPISWLGWCYTPYIIPDNFWGAFAAYAIFTNPKKPISLLSNMVKNIVSMELGVYQGNNIEAQRVFRDQFQSKMNVKSSKRLVLQTKDWGHGNIYYDKILGKRSTQDFYRIIQEEIKDAWGPNGSNVGIKAIIGRWDPLGQNQVLSQWMSALPQLRKNIQIYNNIGHFIEERKPKEIANSIIRLNRL